MKISGQEGRKFSPLVLGTKTEPSSLKIRNFDFSQFSCFHTSAISIILKLESTRPKTRESSGFGAPKTCIFGVQFQKNRFNPMFFGFGASRAEKNEYFPLLRSGSFLLVFNEEVPLSEWSKSFSLENQGFLVENCQKRHVF